MNRRTFAVYYLTLVLLFLASFFPSFRVWGYNQWAHFPLHVPILLFALGAIAPLLLRFFTPNDYDQSTPSKSGWLISGILITFFAAAFVIFRNETHFLGDGYLQLSLLAEDNPLIKNREFGESLAHILVRNLLGGAKQDAALLSYQIISIGSGIGFIAAVLFFSQMAFVQKWQRVCFLLGMLSGGYSLLFFGYVENYSLFALAVTAFTLTGLLAALGRISSAWSIVFVALAIFFHIFGVVLVPAAVFLVMNKSRVWVRVQSCRLGMKLLISGVLIVMAIVVFYHYYSTNLFFQLAVLPIMACELTAEGYTLFSINHLMDYLNLLFLLLPGIGVAILTIGKSPIRRDLRRPEYIFVFLVCVCALGSAFIFDPKIGMPRDWDLFAFAGIPVSIAVFYRLLSSPRPDYKGSFLIILLGLLVLGPRVAGQTIPSVSLAQAHDYKELDKIKNKNFWHILIKYYEQNGSSQKADSLMTEWNSRFPERQLLRQSFTLLKSGQAGKAAELCQRVLNVNPHYPDAWLNLGLAYKYMGKVDSAIIYYRIANALNPYNARTLGNIASAFIYKGNILEAGHWLDDALKIDSTIGELYYYRAIISRKRGDRNEYLRNLTRAASDERASLEYLLELADIYLQNRDYEKAGRLYKVGLDRGIDKSYVDSIHVAYPQIRF